MIFIFLVCVFCWDLPPALFCTILGYVHSHIHNVDVLWVIYVPCNSKNLHFICSLYGPIRLTSQFGPSGYTWASIHLFCVGECVFICCESQNFDELQLIEKFWTYEIVFFDLVFFSVLGAYKVFQKNTKTSHLRWFAIFMYTTIQKFGVG